MNPSRALLRILLLLLLPLPLLAEEVSPEQTRLKELDAYWAEVSRAVGAGDLAAYEATCHPEGVLVAGSRKNSSPLADALKRWKKEFDATKSGEMKASVEFIFSQRLGDATTAHETGMFLYSATQADGKQSQEYIHFEGLLVKRDGRWKILMEYQKSQGTRAEYEAMKISSGTK
jgi:ketosteroid isomerase-like protein